MRDCTIEVTEDGTIKTLYQDNHPVKTMGILDVYRASDVRFDNEIQKWKIYKPLANGTEEIIGNSHNDRISAIEEEIKLLEKEMMCNSNTP